MLKVMGTVFVSKQRDGEVFGWSDSGKVMYLNLGHSRYDKNAENNRAVDFFRAKVFDSHLIDRIQKMNLRSGSNVSIIATQELSYWTDKETGRQRSEPSWTLLDIEYTPTNKKPDDEDGSGQSNAKSQKPASAQGQPRQPARPAPAPEPTNDEYEFYDGNDTDYSFTDEYAPSTLGGGDDEDTYNI